MTTPVFDAGPLVRSDGVMFRVLHQDGLEELWLFQEAAWPRGGWEFEREGDVWTLVFPRPDADRMEYLVEHLFADGRHELRPDEGNPLRAGGPFGDKSVIEFPEYRAPAWVMHPDVPPGETRSLRIDVPSVCAQMDVIVWSSVGSEPDEALPLLVVHDGPEYAQYSQLLMMLEQLTATGKLPAMRAALLQPIARDEHYSASPDYAAALALEALPALTQVAPVPPGRRMRVGMGSSLGALSMLHVHRSYPPSLGGLFLQSGSFFHHRYDRHDIGFEHFQRVRQFIDRVHAERAWDQPIPVVITCGGVEMNFANNRATARMLIQQGYPVEFVKARDAHNWVAWRDLFEPHLVHLLQELWG